ncbi:hypothetical protein, partial [uncultured Desulfovibrio sp.]|uniref:hypothetical protein n=1 Tax=uncultured Desulfovibrio sp. TaxID=167968 RepID=UPI002670A2F8
SRGMLGGGSKLLSKKVSYPPHPLSFKKLFPSRQYAGRTLNGVTRVTLEKFIFSIYYYQGILSPGKACVRAVGDGNGTK